LHNVIVLRLFLSLRRTLPILLVPLLTLAVTGCGNSAHPRPVTAPPPSGLISIFEADQVLWAPTQTLERLRRLGVQYVRVMLQWRSVAPTSPRGGFDASSPGAYPAANWAPYDAIDRDAHRLGIGVLFDVTGGAPAWAMGSGFQSGGAPGVWKPSPSQFERFVRAVGTRYSGTYSPPGRRSPLPRVSFWSIWNEPNLGQADLAPQTADGSTVEVSAVMYRQLLDAGWRALHQTGHGADTILIGDLAPYGQSVPPGPGFPQGLPGIFGYMEPLRFLRALYCVDGSLHPLRGQAAATRGCPTTPAGSRAFTRQHPALFQASGFAIHPYPSGGVPPNVVLPVDDPDSVYLATVSRLTEFLDRVTARYRAPRRYPIYSTEYGYLTKPPFPYGAPLQLVPAYLNLAEYMSWRNPRVRSWDQYLLLDPQPYIYSHSHFDSGLEFADGAPKPTYAAYRMPIYLPATREARGGKLAVWGCVRPAGYYSAAPQRAEIQLQRGGHGTFTTVSSVTLATSNCYFDVMVSFSSGGSVRVAWSYPGGPTIYSRLVAIKVG
jgi:hypothetical protein